MKFRPKIEKVIMKIEHYNISILCLIVAIWKSALKFDNFYSLCIASISCAIVFTGCFVRHDGKEEIFFKKRLLSSRGSSIINKRQKWGEDTIALWKLNGMTSTYIEKNKFETR